MTTFLVHLVKKTMNETDVVVVVVVEEREGQKFRRFVGTGLAGTLVADIIAYCAFWFWARRYPNPGFDSGNG
jgi:hypothetical protein